MQKTALACRRFLSTPSVGRATVFRCLVRQRGAISIHALRGEGDRITSLPPDLAQISIHALRGEGDDGKGRRDANITISIHALRGEGDHLFRWQYLDLQPISIHALRGEGDLWRRACPAGCLHLFLSTPSVGRATRRKSPLRPMPWRFLSTPSVGRATDFAVRVVGQCLISIHALRGEGDLKGHNQVLLRLEFLSTPSVGRAT